MVARFLKEHLLGLCIFAILTGVATNFIYDAVTKHATSSSATEALGDRAKPQPTETQTTVEERRFLAFQQAIRTHDLKFGVEVKKLWKLKYANPVETRKRMHEIYETLLAIPTYDCPDDYRLEYQRFLGYVEELVNLLDSIPTNDWEVIFELMKDGQNRTLGGSDRSRREKWNTAFRQIHGSLQELAAVALRYDVR